MTAQEIREKYLKFFEERGHKIIPRANLVPSEDATTLFTGSGMQPLVPYLLGAEHPEGQRLVNSQTCLRAEDIDEVGDNRHTTFFEMLGNWSLGDYFKAEEIPWLFEFLVDVVKLDPHKLYISCYIGNPELKIPKDEEAADLWQKLFEGKGIEVKTVDIGSAAEGYDKGMQGGRIFFYDGSKNWWSRAGSEATTPVGDPAGPDTEVFYDFGTLHDLAFGNECHPNCDCGRFLEIGNSVFMTYKRTDKGFEPLTKPNVDFGGGLERIAAAKLGDPDIFKISLMWPVIEKLQELTGKKYDDHIEAKRVITDHLRAAVWLATDGVMPSNKEQGYVLRRLIRRAIRFAHELGIEQDFVERVAPVVVDIYKADFKEVGERAEESIKTLAKEEKVFRQTLKKGLKEFDRLVKTELTGQQIFTLFDTYGFPPELSHEEAKRRNIKIAKNSQKDFEVELAKQRERSRTATVGQFKGGLGGHSPIHKQYHTATHLAYKALRLVLGDQVVQRGSNITEERLRFDFSHPDKMTPEQIKQVEDIVNQAIAKDYPMTWQEIPTKEALERGALGAFGDKYGDTVKVYTAGFPDQEPFSFEICGGPHVDHTGELGQGGKRFKITKEESSSAGIRRIKAILE